MHLRKVCGGWLACGLAVAGLAAETTSPPTSEFPRHRLQADRSWLLNPPGASRFDASGLLRLAEGTWLTLNDQRPGLFRIRLAGESRTAELVEWGDEAMRTSLTELLRSKPNPWDGEGLARDALGRIYVCDEADRWIIRFDAAAGRVERMEFDWRPVRGYFDARDRNASFEGIAVGEDRLYLANERMSPRIIVVDLGTQKVVDHFKVRPRGATPWNVHYSDLAWFDGSLFVLVRDAHTVLKVEPRRHRILAQYDFGDLESDPERRFRRVHPLAGVMEGLAVDADGLWLVTDNNGLGRRGDAADVRPTLVRCPWPAVR